MKTISGLILFSLHCLFFNSLFGQESVDYIIDQNQDTLWGEVRFIFSNPHSLKIIHASSGKVENYGVEDIQSFSREGVPHYPKAPNVNESLEFMGLVVDGYTHLWQASSGYYLEKEGQMIELERQSGPSESGTVNEKKFQGILKFNLSDCETIPWSDFDQLRYSKKSLVELVKRYNQCKAPQIPTKEFGSRKKYRIRKGIQGGPTGTLVEWLGNSDEYSTTSENRESGISIGAFLEFPFTQTLSGLIQVQFITAQSQAIRNSPIWEERNEYEFSFVDVPIGVKWEGINFGKNNLYLYGGFLLGTPLTKSNVYQRGAPSWQDITSEGEHVIIDQTTSRQGLQIGAGYAYDLGKNSRLLLQYTFEKSKYWDYRFTIQGLKLGIAL